MTSRTLSATAPSTNGWLLFTFLLSAVLVITMASAARGQPRRDPDLRPGAPRNEQQIRDTRVRITYGGRVYLSFPNYDVVLSGAPRSINELGTTAGTAGARVIYRDQRQMRWDGRGFFLHPAYPYELVARYRYADRIVGQGDERWPPVRPRDEIVSSRRPPAPRRVTHHPESVIPADATAVPRADGVSYFRARPWVVKEPTTTHPHHTMPRPRTTPEPGTPSSQNVYPESSGYLGFPRNNAMPESKPAMQVTAHRLRGKSTVPRFAPVSTSAHAAHFECGYASWYPGGTLDCQAVWSGIGP